jgi:hypothetical protein
MGDRTPEDAAKHQGLVEELVDLFRSAGFSVGSAAGVQGFSPPMELPNDGYGNQEEQAPDVYGYDAAEERYIIGLAKTGDGDLETEESLTQYNVFLDQFHHRSARRAMLYIIVPASVVAEFNTLITHYLHPDLWPNVVVVQSRKFSV